MQICLLRKINNLLFGGTGTTSVRVYSTVPGSTCVASVLCVYTSTPGST